MKKIINLYKKYKEVINYLIAGFLTTCVGILSYLLFRNIFNINYIISNILSWIVAVLFAYIINRRYVFESKSKNKDKFIELINFIKYRVVTLIIETFLMYILVDLFKFNDNIVKIFVQIVVIILNYVFSKFFTFKK